MCSLLGVVATCLLKISWKHNLEVGGNNGNGIRNCVEWSINKFFKSQTSSEWVQDLPCMLHDVCLGSFNFGTLEHFFFQYKQLVYFLCVCVYHFLKGA
jgi:hypothetical protein